MCKRWQALCVWLVMSGLAQAQEYIIYGDGLELADFPAELMAGLQAGNAEGAVAAAPSARLQKLKAIEYDRRSSSIFAAWSKPPQAEAAGGDDAAGAAAGPLDQPVDFNPDAVLAAELEAQGQPIPAELQARLAAGATAGEVSATGSNEATAAAAAGNAEAEAAKKQAEEQKLIDAEMVALQRHVTLGDWAAVQSYFAGLTEEEQKGGYERMLQSLRNGVAQRPNVPQQGQAYIEKNQFTLEDVVGLARVPSVELSQPNLVLLGQLLRIALDAGHQLEPFLERMRPELDQEAHVPNRRQLARMLVGAGRERELEGFLPTDEEAALQSDREGLNLLARYYLARYAEEPKTLWLEKAWHVTQSALIAGEIDEAVKTEAIQRAVDLAPKIQEALGERWLEESFAERPERGMEIVAAIGSSASQALSLQPTDADLRLRLLSLQTTAVNALLAAAPERGVEWSGELELLAGNWLREAQFSYQHDDSTTLGLRRQRDRYGNFFYYDSGWSRGGMIPTPIRAGKVLEHRPSDAWIGLLAATLQPKLNTVYAQLYLKLSEEAKAFPYIEALAKTQPKSAEALVEEFLQVWAKNHNPNEQSTRGNPYIFFYGFEERANGIPLTRSKQERNLTELGEWVERLRTLGVDVEEKLVAAAFQAAHSSAEIYRLETIETIFGALATLEPETLAALLTTMRTNLVGIWRDPALQERSKTNRNKKDIESEVQRGYALANETVSRALQDHPSSWRLMLCKAALAHDQNNYKHELSKDPEFSARRSAAFADFHRAAELYAAGVDSLEQDDESTEVYESWFYAALGACDLTAVSHEQQLAAAEIPLIRAALDGLPLTSRERHMEKFANSLFTRMSSASPAVKFRYVREGLAITGDHELVREARDVFDYYNDLVTEIQLVARIDGSDRVGHGAPFGLHVLLRHTKEIERESGGFSKYLQNQNSQNFGWNYGRPLEDYRDKFEEAARETLQEHFEVMSVTFQEPSVTSRAAEPYGWRETPYAYLLLKPLGPEVDRVPALRLDLDFLDTTGYAVLPVESAVLPIDAKENSGETRPCQDIALTQTLDERQAKEGKLVLEVKATARGLPPTRAALLDLQLGDFEIATEEDHGVSVVKFHEEGTEIEAERSWTLQLQAKPGLAEAPKTFTFGTPKVETKTSEHFRFVDADLASVGPVVDLEQSYTKPNRNWLWALLLGVSVVLTAALGWRHRPRLNVAQTARFQVPEPLTPFSVLGLLRDIHAHNGLAHERKSELAGQISALERHYFVEENGPAPDLRRIAELWVGQAR